ncbi:hypothetical protein AGDE_00128 [Angomonas deanei]|uniref:Tetratricopeptide repeat n=1 Tax=Angomonas deanei TaxID=59799 RepID=S9VS91_9TRYP|nr:hypothetical protein AGDE_09856 [Angomonas deanei]EPY43793.1 hypothetical protein AGDE_00128 [Angomonas deanei]CAD2221113.1 hypothetical protein, conserved [Angomonas deanei]|eukprot:EPY29755.1 hypothetical protein AGDE_09856 [Angomonas deanei]
MNRLVLRKSLLAAKPVRWFGTRLSGVSSILACPTRYCSTQSTKPVSAVNVEEFTLNEEVVQRDMENLSKWNTLAESLDSAKAEKDSAKLLAEVNKGLTLLEELGAINAPIQCECLLCMEAAQVHYNEGRFDEAEKAAERAKKSLLNEKEHLRDAAQIAEIDQFLGFVYCGQNRPEKAHEVFTAVLRWIDVDAKSAMPMQAVAAVNLRRVVLTGVGQSLKQLADKKSKNGEDAKEDYGKALDILIESLNLHIDENDFNLVKSTLNNILQCFESIGDAAQAVTTCRKYVSWCERHNDAAGVEEGNNLLKDLCARHKIPEEN